MITIAYRNMWPHFEPSRSPLNRLLLSLLSADIELTPSEKDADIVVHSVYPTLGDRLRFLGRYVSSRVSASAFDVRSIRQAVTPRIDEKQINIWWSPENIRNPMGPWDLCLGYDGNDLLSKSVYLPFWIFSTDLFGPGQGEFIRDLVSIRDLTQGRQPESAPRPRFCCAFIRNPDTQRLRAIEALQQIGQVDVYGPLTGRPVPDKISVAQHYRFMLCFENDLYPGYITEKPVEAWGAGCVPLYWGLDLDRTLKTNAMVNLTDHSGIRDFVAAVAKINSSEDALREMQGTALVNKLPDLEYLQAVLSRLVISK